MELSSAWGRVAKGPERPEKGWHYRSSPPEIASHARSRHGDTRRVGRDESPPGAGHRRASSGADERIDPASEGRDGNWWGRTGNDEIAPWERARFPAGRSPLNPRCRPRPRRRRPARPRARGVLRPGGHWTGRPSVARIVGNEGNAALVEGSGQTHRPLARSSPSPHASRPAITASADPGWIASRVGSGKGGRGGLIRLIRASLKEGGATDRLARDRSRGLELVLARRRWGRVPEFRNSDSRGGEFRDLRLPPSMGGPDHRQDAHPDRLGQGGPGVDDFGQFGGRFGGPRREGKGMDVHSCDVYHRGCQGLRHEAGRS